MFRCAGGCGHFDMCPNCADVVQDIVWCDGCGRRGACEECAFQGEYMTMCTDIGELGCASCYCPECVDENLIFYDVPDDSSGDDADSCEHATDGDWYCLCLSCSRTVDPSAEALRRAARPRCTHSRSSSDADD